ncbi:MAG: flagellar protein FlaG [Chloroflexota bacterium]
MTDNVTTQVGSAGNVLPANLGRVEYAQAAQVAAARPEKVEGSGAPREESRSKETGGVKVDAKASRPLGDVSLKFEIDNQTHDVTILILDKASRQVVRTIPPDEMARMDPGELLQLFA